MRVRHPSTLVSDHNSATENPRHLLWQYLLDQKWAYAVSVISIVIAEIITVQFPHILGNFTDALQAGNLTATRVMQYSLVLLAVGVGYVIFYGIGQFRNGQSGRRFEYQLRQRLFSHWELLSANYYRQRSIGDLLNHALTDVGAIRDALTGGVNTLTNAVVLLIATLYMTFATINVKLTLFSIIPLLFVPFFIVWWSPRIRDASRRVQEGLSDMADLSEESLTAIRLVKASSNEEVELNRFKQRVEVIMQRQMQRFRQSAMFQTMIPFTGSVSFAIALVYGGYLTLHHQIPLGSFVAFTLYLAMILQPLQQMGFVFNYFQRASASLARLSVLLGEVPEIQDCRNPIRVETIAGGLDVDIAEFRYPDGDRPVLKNIRFSVQPGETLGIVGRTGCGKTTLANLIPRIFEPEENSIFIDGHDIRRLSLKDLRGAISYVPQDGFLFSATVGENIAFAKENVTTKEIWQAARDSAIYDEIVDFPNGFDTLVGERGITLSGGQRQRTAIARAFVKNAPILLMDDSLSAVDMNAEKKILGALKRVRRDKTSIIIAHRLSAVRHADLILVMENGEIVERGTHEELLQLGGTYWEIYQMQENGEGAAG